jgi:hypothetical protein
MTFLLLITMLCISLFLAIGCCLKVEKLLKYNEHGGGNTSQKRQNSIFSKALHKGLQKYGNT